jgi:hypothetical protein
MNIPNYAKKTLIDNKEYIFEVTKASEKLFDSIDEVFFQGKNREVKILRREDNTCIYVLDKQDKNLNVYWEKIEDFQDDSTSEELLHYTNLRLQECENGLKDDDDGKLHLVTIHGSKRSEFLKQIGNGTFQEEKKPTELEKEIERVRKLGANDEFINKFFSKLILAEQDPKFIKDSQYNFDCSDQPAILRDYLNVLNKKGFLNTTYDEKFFKDLNKEGYSKRDQYLPSHWKSINYFIDVSTSNNLLSYSQRFIYNDGDNSIHMHNDHLVVSDQTCGYYFDIKDKDNYKVYFLEKEYKGLENEIKRIEKSLESNTIDYLKDITLEVSNGKTVYQNDMFMHILDLCFTYTPDAMKEEGLKKKNKPKTKKLK